MFTNQGANPKTELKGLQSCVIFIKQVCAKAGKANHGLLYVGHSGRVKFVISLCLTETGFEIIKCLKFPKESRFHG